MPQRLRLCGDSVASGTESGLAADGDLTLLLGIIGLVLIFGLLGGLLFMRGNKPEIVGEDWNQAVPATDMVANSMYGGAEQLFQQQYAQPPVAQPIVTLAVPTQPGMPPLPASGLPAGWTMEQWSHYGHTYLEQTGQ
jgi:hypothetical protein